MRSPQFLLVATALLLALPGGAADKDDAFTGDKRDFGKRFTTIALSPVDADPLFVMPERVARILEEEVTTHLEKHGYTVIPSSVLADIRKAMARQVGGLDDPGTGKPDAAKPRAVRSHALRELWYREQFDAVATIRVTTATARFAKGSAEWDGVKQKVDSEGRDKGYGGSIVASSVSFAVFDEAMRPQYVFYGGL